MNHTTGSDMFTIGGAANEVAQETFEEMGCAAFRGPTRCNNLSFGKCKWGPACIPKDPLDVTSYATCAQAGGWFSCKGASGLAKLSGSKGCQWVNEACHEA
eukprot:CAMPEP_0174305386 /NCGR_PEP_ID=MMETSP0809-20121228/61381_1 /TAXON_ID=73025 ORGANISM="Eutreptiella gymnastica-like, Strain CCMP1594" /NCGR_SAMPLE_ID=MMETSP0809 /ASSEMBLY_ACC=CAM_ASM_000658 /LENGTH=100 /DNA_ID=CAMNT_0015411849 /DNA_START=17 /DNA_END=319 /DNA_ORIENTATION=+